MKSIDLGCVITHENFIHGMFGIGTTVNIMNSTDTFRFLNYMPLAHLFGCGSLLCITYLGKMTSEIKRKRNSLLVIF